MSNAKRERLEQRQRLLEIEAEMQRVSISATFESWRERRALLWMAEAGTALVQALAIPKVRWMLFAALLSRLKPGRAGR
jgi:hypothetical protein